MEKNRKILDEALRQLPAYSPEEQVWDALQTHLPLADAVSKLKAIDPPPLVWDAIANELDAKENIDHLRQYTPDDGIWNKIDDALSAEQVKTRRLIIFGRIAWIAAAYLAIVMTYFLIIPNQQKSNISYSEEIIETENPNRWQDDDTEIYDLINALCDAKPLACSQPDFKAKQAELDYLNEKKSEILERLNAYDQHKGLQILLTKIELEKNEIVKQMIAKVM